MGLPHERQQLQWRHHTPLLRQACARAADPEAKRRREIESTLLNRLGRPEEIASVVGWFAACVKRGSKSM